MTEQDITERLRTHHHSLATQSFIMHEAADTIESLRAELAARDARLADEAFSFAQAVFLDLLDVELEDALKAEGIYVYGPEAEKFQRMFAAAMKTRRTLIEAGAYRETAND